MKARRTLEITTLKEKNQRLSTQVCFGSPVSISLQMSFRCRRVVAHALKLQSTAYEHEANELKDQLKAIKTQARGMEDGLQAAARAATDAERSLGSTRVIQETHSIFCCSLRRAPSCSFFVLFCSFSLLQRRNEELEAELQEAQATLVNQRRNITRLQAEKVALSTAKDELVERAEAATAQNARIIRTQREKEEEVQVCRILSSMDCFQHIYNSYVF